MKNEVLFINACVREGSRTKRLADKLLQLLNKPYEELDLSKIEFTRTDESFLKERDKLIAERAFDDPMFDLARSFSEADEIVIAAPYWDLSFPAVLKEYIEKVCVNGVTFRYSDKGMPVGLCKARRLFYVTTTGGEHAPDEFGFGYIKALAQVYYGIPEVRLIKAVGLDIYGADPEAIMSAAERELSSMAGIEL